MAKITELLAEFLRDSALNVSEIERLAGVSSNTLRQAKEGKRGIPKKHCLNVLAVCVRYGFVIPSKPDTRILVDLDERSVILCTDLQDKQNQYRIFYTEKDFLLKDF